MTISVSSLGGNCKAWYTPAMYAIEQEQGTSAVIEYLVKNGILAFDDYLEITEQTFSWGSSDYDLIALALEAHYAGSIDITDYVSVGDTRAVSLSAMNATGVGESHSAQSKDLVIVHTKKYDLSDNSGKAAILIGMATPLATTGYIHATADTSVTWANCARRTWCNEVFKAAIPSSLRSLIKQVKVDADARDESASSENKITNDYCFLFHEDELGRGGLAYTPYNSDGFYLSQAMCGGEGSTGAWSRTATGSTSSNWGYHYFNPTEVSDNTTMTSNKYLQVGFCL